MSERIVDNPANHGWVEENGKWVWGASGGSGGGSIADGDTEGQITTWSGTEWTPEGAVVVSGGNVGIGTAPDPLFASGKLNVDGDILGKWVSGGKKFIGWKYSTTYSHGMEFDESTRDLVIKSAAGDSAGQISFQTASGTERMRIDANGNVGIGGSLMAGELSLFAEASPGSYGQGWIIPTHTAGGAAYQGGMTFQSQRWNGSAYERVDVIAFDSTGRVDITGSLYVNGSEVGSGGGGGGGLPDGGYTYGWTITASDFIATSDERLKDDISPLPVGLIDDIKPVQWNWKDGSGKSAGVIAQQLQSIGLDDFVNEDADGNLGVNYNALVGVLLAEVISLKTEVEALK